MAAATTAARYPITHNVALPAVRAGHGPRQQRASTPTGNARGIRSAQSIGGAAGRRLDCPHGPTRVGHPTRSLTTPCPGRWTITAASSSLGSPESPLNTNGFHVHFGAGKLGLGLVFGALVNSNVPFAILQNPARAQSEALLNDSTVDVLINGESAIPGGLTVVTAENYASMKEGVKGGRTLVLIDPDGPEWNEIIQQATSFSCSLGPNVCEIIGAAVEKDRIKLPKEMRPMLFACENDHNAVEKLEKLLEGKVEVISCMVDRICSTRKVVPGAIEVGTEPWEGTLVPLIPIDEEDCRVPIPFGGSNVFIPKTIRESNYMYDRKIMTVNHMHTTLAFLTLVQHMKESGATPEEMVAGESACISLPLIEYDESVNPPENYIWCWAVAQVLLLMSEHDRSTMRKSHLVTTDEELNKDLLQRAKLKLERFSAVEDSTARVLGAGVDKRYNGRLLPAYQAVKTLRDCMSKLPADNRYQSLLDLAGVTMDEVVNACEYLVTAAEPLAAADRAYYVLKEEAEAEPLLQRMQSSAATAEKADVSLSLSEDSDMIALVKDVSLEWVACRLGDIGFQEYGDWQNSVEGSYMRKLTKDEVEALESMDWMRSFEERKKVST